MEKDMNFSELSDEQLDMIAGGSGDTGNTLSQGISIDGFTSNGAVFVSNVNQYGSINTAHNQASQNAQSSRSWTNNTQANIWSFNHP